jgi:pimeloyl-ACP methyl ester carboxylesterase
LARPGAFDDDAADFQAEPFEDPAVLRASLSFYEVSAYPELLSEPPLLMQPNHVTETMILYGMEDKVVGPKMADRAEIAYGKLVGPFVIAGGGHFLPWEKPGVFNSALICFCREPAGRPGS